MDIKRVGVVGAGTMGNGIAHVFARCGYEVVLCDVEQRFLDRALDTIGKNLEREVAKNKLTAEQKASALKRIVPVVDREKLADCDFVVEAATEQFEIKAQLFRDLDRICRQEIIISSNTSSISITKLGALTRRPDKVIGMHFFNPVPLLPLVEIIRGIQTSAATIEAVRELTVKLDKSPISVKNAPGFVVNRILVPMINEAFFVLAEGIATAEEIDLGMRLGANHPIGPLALADLIGLDVCLSVLDVFLKDFGDSKYRASPLLRELVAAGRLGRKVGQGVYRYD